MIAKKDEVAHSSAHWYEARSEAYAARCDSTGSPLVGAMGPFDAVGGARVDGVAGVGGTEGREPGGPLSALRTRAAMIRRAFVVDPTSIHLDSKRRGENPEN